jgi:hypothetical protein
MSSSNGYNTRSSKTTTSTGESKRKRAPPIIFCSYGADDKPTSNDTKPTTRKQSSTVPLKGSGSGRKKESALKKKEKVEGMTKKLKEEQKELKKKLDNHEKALKILDGKTGDISVQTILRGAYEELGMKLKGMSTGTTEISQNPNILQPDSVNAMAQQTSPKSAKQISRCEYRLATHPSRMNGGKMGFTFGSKTTTNKRNKTVNLNASKAAQDQYEFMEKHDYGLGRRNREMALDLEPQMIELCVNHAWIASIAGNRNKLIIAETPDEDEWPE